jgi:hypothetical protein
MISYVLWFLFPIMMVTLFAEWWRWALVSSRTEIRKHGQSISSDRYALLSNMSAVIWVLKLLYSEAPVDNYGLILTKGWQKTDLDLSSERVDRAWLCCRGPATTVNYRPDLSSERVDRTWLRCRGPAATVNYRPDLSSETVDRAWQRWREPSATVNYRPVLSSERALQNNKRLKEKEKLVAGPRSAPDTKTDWPTDCRS